ncbi:microfibril-associated glycoprotein 4-like [Anopheles ziemanni]|uniref:microfibril-associated glycoprotein 4-like n=1 Tax=Anopheles coustani TaxID=139045 RepID=UPI00265ACF13|nr:microfibril-associated glycoprotein 4-like [Anopheles coustani]XP_058170536.1 microfibril-associated glycoprotein 4-like [Anopheles ziemanni]
MAKLDFLQYKLYEIELGLKERDEAVKEKLTKLEDSIDGIQWEIHRHDRDAGHNLTVLKAHSQQILAQQTACASHEQMRKEIAQLSANTTQFKQSPLWYVQKSSSISRTTGPFKSCKEAPANVSGVYLIQLSDNESPFDAFCEQNSFGGGWLVIQYRYDGSLDFYRNWTEYQKGFGSVDREHWLGLERLHQVTSRQQHELLIELKDFNGTCKFARYTNFTVGTECEQYVLHNLGTYTGTAGDSLSYHSGMKFSTFDRDNDASSDNCANKNTGAWWFNACDYSNLNGLYLNEVESKTMYWYYFKSGSHALAYSKMMIREV